MYNKPRNCGVFYWFENLDILFVVKLLSIEIKNVGCAVLSGLLLTCAFPKIGLDWIVWFALLPLFYAIQTVSVKESFRIGLIAGLAHYLSLLYWVVPTMHTYGFIPLYLAIPVLFLFATALGLFLAVFCWTWKRLANSPTRILILTPLTWVAFEYLRSFLFSGFPWAFLGHSQVARPDLIQISDTVGVYGVSFLIVFCNATLFLCLAYLIKHRWGQDTASRGHVLVALLSVALLTGLTLGYGRWQIKSVDRAAAAARRIRVAVIQGNIDQALKWDPKFQMETIRTYNRLSLSVQADRPDLVIWPESATPFYFLYERDLSLAVLQGIKQTATDFLIGSPSFARRKQDVVYYNSAFLIDAHGRLRGKYDKSHLVPFGEYVPFHRWLPFLGKMVAQVGDFKPGHKGKTIRWENEVLGIQICYEIIFPPLAGAMVKNGATLLINITNDAWFGKSSGPFQHFSLAVFRAIENRRALARAANTGISGFIDPVGRIMTATALGEEAAVVRELPLLTRKTFYTLYGDVFAIACLVITGLAAILAGAKYIFLLKK